MRNRERSEADGPGAGQRASSAQSPWLFAAFFVSGCPALIYQLVWQRALFTIYGVNVEAITAVVAAFMLGLGLGSIAGGALSKLAGNLQLLLFAGLELGIGIFGLGSLALFAWVGRLTLGAGALETGLLTFLLVLLPTCLMGATLPLLVAHLVRRYGNVGRSLGVLYFVNTLGSAAACFLAALWLLRALGMQGSANLAAALNFLVGATALWLYARSRGSAEPNRMESEVDTGTGAVPVARPLLPLRVGLLLSAASGFIALSYEIVWSRVYGFASRGSAHSFPLLLGCYLLGIAIGSYLCGRHCARLARDDRSSLRLLAVLIFAANAVALLLSPLISAVTVVVVYAVSFPLVVLSAGLFGALFPLLGHVSISPDRSAGAHVSYLYFANIVGSTAGTLLTGFVLMDTWTLSEMTLAIAGVGFATACLTLVFADAPARRSWLAGGAALAVVSLAIGAAGHAGIYDRLLYYKRKGIEAGTLTQLIENKHGVIAISDRDTTYGGGVYDGVFAIDMLEDRNHLIRPLSLAAFHPAPRNVLMIGLASGSWAQITAHLPGVEQLTIVEINPGYLDTIGRYPIVRGLLSNPKVKIVIDDGRRWLASYDGPPFDMFVMNTTYHWRANSTNLLSAEFLGLVKRNLAPGGGALINTTWSDESLRTAALVFPNAYRLMNCALVSNDPITPDRERWRRALEQFRIEGRPLIDLRHSEQRALLERLVAQFDVEGAPPKHFFETRPRILERTAALGSITDDNMLTEWKQLR